MSRRCDLCQSNTAHLILNLRRVQRSTRVNVQRRTRCSQHAASCLVSALLLQQLSAWKLPSWIYYRIVWARYMESITCSRKEESYSMWRACRRCELDTAVTSATLAHHGRSSRGRRGAGGAYTWWLDTKRRRHTRGRVPYSARRGRSSVDCEMRSKPPPAHPTGCGSPNVRAGPRTP